MTKPHACCSKRGKLSLGCRYLGGKGRLHSTALIADRALLRRAAKDHILLAQLDLFHGAANAVGAGGARGEIRVVDTFDH